MLMCASAAEGLVTNIRSRLSPTELTAKLALTSVSKQGLESRPMTNHRAQECSNPREAMVDQKMNLSQSIRSRDKMLAAAQIRSSRSDAVELHGSTAGQ